MSKTPKPTERSITVSVSMSRKLSLQAYGGNPYESLDVWSSETREMPSDTSQEVVDAMRQHLSRTVENDIREKSTKIIQSYKSLPPV
jgi:hypothetical protein